MEKFIPKNSNLKTGMVVEFGSRKRSIVIIDGSTIRFVGFADNQNSSTWFPVDINDDSFKAKISDQRIVKVWAPVYGNNRDFLSYTQPRDLIWEGTEIVELQLNEQYKAVIDKDNRIFKVGCSEFTFDKVIELYKKINSDEISK